MATETPMADADIVVNLDEESTSRTTTPVTTPRDMREPRSKILLGMTGLFLFTLGCLIYVMATK